MFDVYLLKGCKSLPKLDDLVDRLPGLSNREVRENLLGDSPGFLGFNLPFEIARTLIRRLKYTESRALGRIIPIKYRDNRPQFTVESAFPIADRKLKEMQSDYPKVVFKPTTYVPGSSGLMYITFCAGANDWENLGLIPGALFASVDVL